MESRSGRTWLVNAFLIFLPGLFLWILAALLAGSALGSRLNFLANLDTHLLADYRPDSFGQSLKSLKLAIFGDVFSDLQFSEEEIASLELMLQGLVPTATLEEGAILLPFTPMMTATDEPIPASNPTQTQSPSSTPKIIPTETKSPPIIATPTATTIVPTATPGRMKVDPILDCVVENGNGTFTAYFGYKNHNSYEITISMGTDNQFTLDPKDRGQPTTFLPGRSPSYPNSSFDVTFDGEPLTWHLDGGTIMASSNSNRCEPVVPETSKDKEPPTIPGGNPDPPPGDLSVCSMTIHVSDLHVVDPSPSSGIAWVKLKYNVEGYTEGYIYSNPLELCSGGMQEDGGWDGCYSGSIEITIDPTWISPAPEPFRIDLYAKAQDHEGNTECQFLGQYTMPASCGKAE